MRKKILAVFAHPDDETDACGSTLALYAKKGVEVYLLCATNGSAGKSGPYKNTSQEELGKIREEELRKAGEILGIKETQILGFSDGELEKTNSKLIEKQIASFIEKTKPDVLLTWDPTGLTFHPDHMITSRLATQVGLELQKSKGFPQKIYWKVTPRSFLEKYELIGMNGERVSGTSDEKITTRINISGFKETKISALQAHRSQRDVLISSFEQAQDLEEESFVLVSPKDLLNNIEQDLFYGI